MVYATDSVSSTGDPQVAQRKRPRVYSPRDIALWIIANEGKPSPRSKQGETSSCPPGLRKRVFAAFARCEYCGCADANTVDRITPRNRYGWYQADNVTRACSPCNTHKGDGEFIGPVRSLAIMEARIA